LFIVFFLQFSLVFAAFSSTHFSLTVDMSVRSSLLRTMSGCYGRYCVTSFEENDLLLAPLLCDIVFNVLAYVGGLHNVCITRNVCRPSADILFGRPSEL